MTKQASVVEMNHMLYCVDGFNIKFYLIHQHMLHNMCFDQSSFINYNKQLGPRHFFYFGNNWTQDICEGEINIKLNNGDIKQISNVL
jgi:hypothetical protein